jgi:hypothetical protein
VHLARCKRSQLFTKNTLPVTVQSVRLVRLTYTMYDVPALATAAHADAPKA